MSLSELLSIDRGQWHSGPLEHNYLVVWARGYKVSQPPASDPAIVLLNPWIKIAPEVFTTKTHPAPPTNLQIR